MATMTASRLIVTTALGVLLSGLLAGPAAAEDPVGMWPLRPEPDVVADFDPPPGPFAAGHRGVDLAAQAGQPVHAALAGRVSFAGALAGRGVVVVDHGPTRTTYEPVAAGVSVGDQVAVGQRIGTLQASGSHCPPAACLHWGWIQGAETYLDPLRLVGAGPVRLLPLAGLEPIPATRASLLPYSWWLPLPGVLRLFGAWATGPAPSPGA